MKKQDKKKQFENDAKWLFKKNLLHRGKFDNVKVYENTIEAYQGAIDLKMPFEFDVQLTNDLQVICFHDTNLKRLFNRERDVSDISFKRINKLRDDLQVPLLKDVLKLVDGKVELMIELKSTKRKLNKILVEKVAELLKDYKGKYVIVSFNPFLLSDYKSLDRNAYIGRILSENAKGFVEKLIIKNNRFNFWVNPDFISYDISNFDEKKISKFKKKGYKIIGWTLKEKEAEKDLKKHYDNFIIEG